MEIGVQHTSAAPSGVRHLTVHAGAGGVDVVVSAQTPLGSLLPAIVDVLAIDPGPVAVQFQLLTPSGSVLDTSKTLIELGIRDGTTLSLIRSQTEFPAPPSDDAAEAVSAAVTTIERGWTRRSLERAGTLLAFGSAGVTAVVLVRAGVDDAHHAGCAATSAAISVLALLAAAGAYRIAGAPGAGMVLGVIATGFAAIAGLIGVPEGPGTPNALFAAAAAAPCAVVMCGIACQTVVFTALACFATTCVTAAAVCVLADVSLPAMGAGLAAVSLAVIEASPAASVMLTRLSAQQIRDAPDQWELRIVRAHRWLAGLMSAFSASAALGAVGALLGTSPPRLLFAAVVGGLLLLRSRAHRDVSRSLPPLICGAVTLAAVFVAGAEVYPEYAPHVAALATLLGSGAVYLGFSAGPTMPSPVWRRTVEVVEYLGFATVVPLTFWLCGLLSTVRGMNLS